MENRFNAIYIYGKENVSERERRINENHRGIQGLKMYIISNMKKYKNKQYKKNKKKMKTTKKSKG